MPAGSVIRWDLRDEIAEIVGEALEPYTHLAQLEANKVTDRIMDLLERSAADEPLQTTGESRDNAAV